MPDFKRRTNRQIAATLPLEPGFALPKSAVSVLPFGVPADAPATPAERLAYRFA